MNQINLLTKKRILQLTSGIILNSSVKTLRNLSFLVQMLAPKKDRPFFKRLRSNFTEGSINHQLYKRILVDSNPNFRRKTIDNFVINGSVLNQAKRNEAQERGEAVPTVVLMSPTMRCNLSCTGCYANNYSRKDDLDFDTVISADAIAASSTASVLYSDSIIQHRIHGGLSFRHRLARKPK